MRCLDNAVSTLVLCLLFLFMPLAETKAQDGEAGPQAQEPKDYETRRVAKTVEGLTFDVEEDRPIVKKDGVYQPLDIDSYVALRIERLRKEMETRVVALEERLARLEAALEALQQEAPGSPPETQDAL